MSDKINIEEILSKYIGVVRAPEVKSAMKAAIREIVEAVIDKCTENSKVIAEPTLYNMIDGTNVKEINSHIVGCHYFEGYETEIDTDFMVDKESILQVRNMIDYE